MASKLQTTIKLYLKDEEGNFTSKQFKSAEMLPGSVMEDATELQVELEEIVKTNDMEEIRPVLRKCYDFIAKVIFEGQFTGQEFLDGMDAREILKITGQLLGLFLAVMMQFILIRKKVTDLLYHPHFKFSPQYREAELKIALLENGWTLNEIENTDLKELMKLYAFRDAVKEFEELKFLDEHTMF